MPWIATQDVELCWAERTLLGRNESAEADEALWKAARAGDGEMFGALFDRHGGAVFAHCRRLSASAHDAEDMTSVVFLEALRRADAIRFVDGSALPWLLVVATNVARNHSRARRRYGSLLARLPDPSPAPDIADEVVTSIASIEAGARVAAALKALSMADQRVLALCDLAGLSYLAASQALRVPVGTIRSRLSRARARLRKELAAHDPSADRAVARNCLPSLADYPGASR
jgi:RNA polymerase sigma factor (sigma-70 family)